MRFARGSPRAVGSASFDMKSTRTCHGGKLPEPSIGYGSAKVLFFANSYLAAEVVACRQVGPTGRCRHTAAASPEAFTIARTMIRRVTFVYVIAFYRSPLVRRLKWISR